MPAWLHDTIQVTPWLGAAGVIVWLAVKLTPLLRKVSHFIDDVVGEPERPGIPARPGLMERISDIETQLADVRHEVTTNHGSSLKDALKRVESRLDQHVAESEPLKRQVADLHTQYTTE